MEYTHADLDLAIATRANEGTPPASDLERTRADAIAAFSDEPRVSIFALCGSFTPNRANVPLSDLRLIAKALNTIAENPTGPLAQRFAVVPGLVR